MAWEWEEDGSLRLRGRLPADQGALLVKAIEIVSDHLRVEEPANVSAEAPAAGSIGASRADALASIADGALAGTTAGRTGGDRVQLVVHIDADALAGDAGGRCELDRGPALSRATARRLACDASVVRIDERDGAPLSLGRKTRSISPALRRALRARDGGCRFPGCTNDRFVDAHHVKHWADGGRTELVNLVHLCTHHHRLLHEGGFSVRSSPGGAFEFRTPTGRVLRAAPRPARRRMGCVPLPRVSAETPIQERFDPLDLSYAVDAMLQTAPLRSSA